MEKLRLKQAQKLIEEAGKREASSLKLKSPREGIIDSNVYTKCINELIEAEEFIYLSRPSHKLNKNEAEQFCNKILDVRTNLDSILSDFGVIEKKEIEEEIKEISNDILFITSKSSFKKILTRFGIDSQKVIVAGVPLEVNDMKILNPKIPDAALSGISKKIEHVKNDIERKINTLNIKRVLVIVENDNAGIMLGKRSEKLYNANVIILDNIKDVTVNQFKNIIS